MKEILVLSTVGDTFAGQISGIQLKPIPETNRVKLVGVISGSNLVTLATYEDLQEAIQVFMTCGSRIMDPTVDPVVLTFMPKEQEDPRPVRQGVNTGKLVQIPRTQVEEDTAPAEDDPPTTPEE